MPPGRSAETQPRSQCRCWKRTPWKLPRVSAHQALAPDPLLSINPTCWCMGRASKQIGMVTNFAIERLPRGVFIATVVLKPLNERLKPCAITVRHKGDDLDPRLLDAGARSGRESRRGRLTRRHRAVQTARAA